MDDQVPAHLQPLYKRLAKLVDHSWSSRRTGISVTFKFPETTSGPGLSPQLSVTIDSNDLDGIQAIVDKMHLPDDVRAVCEWGGTLMTIGEFTKRCGTLATSQRRSVSVPRRNKTSKRLSSRTRIPDP